MNYSSGLDKLSNFFKNPHALYMSQESGCMWRLTQAALYSSSTLHYTGSSHSHKQTFTSAVAAGQIRQQRLSSLTFPWLYRLLDHMAVCAWKQVVTGWDLRKLRTVVSPIKTLPKGPDYKGSRIWEFSTLESLDIYNQQTASSFWQVD